MSIDDLLTTLLLQILNERYEKRKAAQERLDLKRKLRAKKKGQSAEGASTGSKFR